MPDRNQRAVTLTVVAATTVPAFRAARIRSICALPSIIARRKQPSDSMVATSGSELLEAHTRRRRMDPAPERTQPGLTRNVEVSEADSFGQELLRGHAMTFYDNRSGSGPRTGESQDAGCNNDRLHRALRS
jgi:hypothetical protein